MTYERTLKTAVAAGVVGALLATVSSIAWAAPDTPAQPLALRKIMRDMGKNMQAITGGISSEDWDLVTKFAPLIAVHPQPPPEEKVRIVTFFGAEMGRFKGLDEKSSQAAQELEQSAKRRDGPAVIGAFATLQNSCLACHQSFRKPFKEHFYDKR